MASQSREEKAVPSAPRAPTAAPGEGSSEAAERAEHRLPRFRVTAGRFGGIDGVMLSDVADGAHVILALRGATLLDWCVPFGGGMLSLTDGYCSRIELYRQDGVRNGLMAPFPNRIAAGCYHFEHRDHDLLPAVEEGKRLIYHGFLRELDLELGGARERDDGAQVLFVSDAIQPGVFPGYPFALALHVLVRFGLDGLSLVVTATNLGHVSAPYAAGWHPYFRFGEDNIDHLELQVPASQAILTDVDLLPLPGEAAYVPIARRPDLDFRGGRALGGGAVDACLGALAADADGLIRSRLRDPVRGCGLVVWQQGGLVHLFTGDTLARNARRSLAIEPVEVMTDAFNRADCQAAISLPPGASRSFRCGAQFVPAMQPLAAPGGLAGAAAAQGRRR